MEKEEEEKLKGKRNRENGRQVELCYLKVTRGEKGGGG